MLLKKITNKLGFFIKKIPFKVVKLLLLSIMFFDYIFLKLRINLLNIFFSKNRISKALKELKNSGVAIIPNFYSEEQISKIKNNCIKQLDELPLSKLSNNTDVSNMSVKINNQDLKLERLGGSLKLKGLQKINNFFKNIGRNFEANLITLVYHLTLSKPFLVYNITHDGSFKHSVLPSPKTDDEAIAGTPHVDLYLHKLRCFVALSDVNANSGPTVFYKNSMNLKEIKKNHLNLFLENFEFDIDENGSHILNEKKLNYLEQTEGKSLLTCNKGDLVLIDLKTAHYGTLPKKGQRHLLWFYY